jgi:hypothetical protein
MIFIHWLVRSLKKNVINVIDVIRINKINTVNNAVQAFLYETFINL